MIGIIKRNFVDLKKDTFLKLYKSIVRPHVEYGNIIWHPLYSSQSKCIEQIQRRATKLLRECRGLTYMERLNYLHLHSLQGRRARGDLIETYKLYHNITDLEWNRFFDNPINTNTRNNTGKIRKRHCNTNLRLNCFSNRVTNLWNELPVYLKQANNINAFKNHIDMIPKLKVLFKEFH